jgi:hypothetical protein
MRIYRRAVLALVLGVSCAALGADVVPDTRHAPENSRTPGIINAKVTQGNIQQTICRPSWIKSNLPPVRYLTRVKMRQLKDWHYQDRDPAQYVADHRIPIAVGGHPRAAGNLWPQPQSITWNATAKNKLETYMHGEVCAGRMKLDDARAVFQRDWVDVFKLYCGPEPDADCKPPGTPGVQIVDPKAAK